MRRTMHILDVIGSALKSLPVGVSPQTPRRVHEASPDPLAGFNGAHFKAPTSNKREGGERGKKGRKR